jgi:hypothetical protein
LFMADAVWIAVLLLLLEVTVVRAPRDLPVGAGSRHV